MSRDVGDGEGPIVVRSGGNRGGGLFLAVGVLLFMTVADPHGLVFGGFDAEGGTPNQLLLWTLGMAILSIGGYTLFARPYLVVWPGDRVVVRNPLREVTLPVERLEQVDDAGKYLRLRSGRDWHTAWGTEQVNYKLARGEGSLGSGLLSVEPTHRCRARPVQVRWRRVTFLEALLLLAWVPHLAKGGMDAFL